MPSELDPVFIEPTTFNNCKPIKCSDTLLCEDSSENVADDTTDSMGSKDLNVADILA